MITRYCCLFLALFLLNCSGVNFDSEMPKNKKSNSEFNEKIRGSYFLIDSVLKIKDDFFYNSLYSKNTVDLDSFNLIYANIKIGNTCVIYTIQTQSYYNSTHLDTIRISQKHLKETKSKTNNYIIYNGTLADTLINLQRNDLVKSFNNKYYLNKFVAKKDWEIYQIIMKDSILFVNTTNEVDKKILKKYTRTREIFGDIAHLSDIQFNEFVNKGGFRQRYKFKKRN